VEEDIAPFFPKADVTIHDTRPEGVRKALLIVGSPKVKKRSTSSVLGEYLIEIMKENGWDTEVLTLKGSLSSENGQAELCAAVDRSDLLILAFPLHIDALPYLVTKAFEVIVRHRKASRIKKPQKLFTIINNGFPEFYQNALALAICRCFADQCGIYWSGSLAMGSGEALGGGRKLTHPKRSGPPVKHIIKALDKAGADLVQGRVVSPVTQSLISKTPIPIVSFGIWRWMFMKLGGKLWRQQALENGINKEEMYVKPYAD
jgi:hypothetical protein